VAAWCPHTEHRTKEHRAESIGDGGIRLPDPCFDIRSLGSMVASAFYHTTFYHTSVRSSIRYQSSAFAGVPSSRFHVPGSKL
jgi:hypothetical protein